MEEKRGGSSGVSSELASDSKISGEKRNGNGLDEKQELGSKRPKVLDLDSDDKAKKIGTVEEPNLSSEKIVPPDGQGLGSVVKHEEGLVKDIRPPGTVVESKDIRPGTVVETKVDAVSAEDDDRRVVVANSGKEDLLKDCNVKEEKNCESGGGQVDVGLKSSSVVKPKEGSESVVSPRGVAETNLGQRDVPVSLPGSEKVGTDQITAGSTGNSDSMKRWMEMKKNGFLSGPLGGVTAPSSAVATTPVEVPAPKQSKNKRKNDSFKKRNEVPRKEQQQVDRFSNVTAPSGLLTELNPGIISHVRSQKQVCSIIESLIRNATYNASKGDKRVNMNVRESEKEKMALTFKLPSAGVSDNVNVVTNTEQATALAIEAATVASQWLEFLYQDLSGRLSAVQDSRNRVQNILTTELPLLASSRYSSSKQEMKNTNPSADASSDKTVTEAHQLRWTAKFDQLNKSLYDEEKDLERSLNQVKEMQSRCNEGLRQMDASSPFSSQSSDSSFGKDGNQETSMAVQAAAASIFSTCSFLLSMMKPPPSGS